MATNQPLSSHIKFEIRNNKLDQPLGVSAKMAANGIRTHDRTNQWRTMESTRIPFAAIFADIPEADLAFVQFRI